MARTFTPLSRKVSLLSTPGGRSLRRCLRSPDKVMLVDHAPHSGRQEFFERVVFPRFAPGRDVDREARARHQRQPEFDHELHRQFKLLVRDREPGRDLDIAGWGLQNDRGVGQFAFGLNPAAIGLTIGGKHRAVDLRQEADPVQAGGKALPFRTCRGRQMGQAGRLRAWRLWLLPIDGSLARICRGCVSRPSACLSCLS